MTSGEPYGKPVLAWPTLEKVRFATAREAAAHAIEGYGFRVSLG